MPSESSYAFLEAYKKMGGKSVESTSMREEAKQSNKLSHLDTKGVSNKKAEAMKALNDAHKLIERAFKLLMED